MSHVSQMNPVDLLAAELFVQRIGAWVATGRQDRIRENEVADAATNAYVAAEAFMKVAAARRSTQAAG